MKAYLTEFTYTMNGEFKPTKGGYLGKKPASRATLYKFLQKNDPNGMFAPYKVLDVMPRGFTQYEYPVF